MICARSAALRERSMPIFSIVSSVWRMPAVSMMRKRMPEILIQSSIVSRVVPWISETIALSSCNKALRRVDLPTFGAPIMATGMPFLIAFPVENEDDKRVISSRTSCAILMRASRDANSTSSSEKSSSSSRREVSFSNWARRSESFWEIPPRICCIATRCWEAFWETIRSATASACVRSSFPFRKARWVYSPGAAGWHPCWISSEQIVWRIYGEPWVLISTLSSPV